MKPYSPELIKASCAILAALYGLIAIFPLFWGFPFRQGLESRYIFLFFTPFLLMSVSLLLVTRIETALWQGVPVLLISVGCMVLQMFLLQDAWGNVIVQLLYSLLYGAYFLRAYALGDVYTAKLHGMTSLFDASSQKVMYSPLFLLFLLLISLAG